MDTVRLTVMTFPQRWNGATRELRVRVLVLPRTHPLLPLGPGLPAFAEAKIVLHANLSPSVSGLPATGPDVASYALDAPAPTRKRAAFNALNAFSPLADDPGLAEVPAVQIRKHLPPSYTSAFAFAAPRAPFLHTDDTYRCAFTKARLREGPSSAAYRLTWGRVMAMALQRPVLSQAIGMMYEAMIAVGGDVDVSRGAWLWMTLAAGSDYVAAPAGFTAFYAARLPALAGTDERPLIAAVQFPVDTAARAGEYDQVIAESLAYSDGFAKIVHCYQAPKNTNLSENAEELPPVRDAGLQIGWDDEQVAIWMDRQFKIPEGEARPRALMGVGRYNIDARIAGTAAWTSLQRAAGPIRIGDMPLGDFAGELSSEPSPSQLSSDSSDYWLPSYFVRWTGCSLGTRDDTALRLNGGDPPPEEPIRPVAEEPVPLRYGTRYELRVRLTDVSSGGPADTDKPHEAGPAPIARCNFRRFVPPAPVAISVPDGADLSGPPSVLRLRRPLLGYPEAVFAGIPDARTRLQADIAAARSEHRKPGLPDPDADTVQISVEAAGLHFDKYSASGDEYATVYTAVRRFPADPALPLDVRVEFVDAADIQLLGDYRPADSDPLRLPSARDIRIRFTAVCSKDLEYFGSEEARRSRPSFANLRQESLREDALFAPGTPVDPELRACFIRPVPPPSPALAAEKLAAADRNELPPTPVDRLAQALRVPAKGNTLECPRGRRVVFGCSARIRHTLHPDAGAITFDSLADLTNQWVAVLLFDIARDWTWDALQDEAFTIHQDGQKIGSLQAPRSVNALARQNPDRSRTTFIFFDASDAQRSVREVGYDVATNFKQAPEPPAAPAAHRLTLPAAAPPFQSPRIVSAGMALTPFRRDETYSRTFDRRKMLWLEFAEPPAPGDAYFARVLAYAPDPMLTGILRASDAESNIPNEPALPIDPEWMRVILPSSADDKVGLDAMQQLLPTDSPVHYLLPAPHGVEPDGPELFGMFTYEFRAGHVEAWSTATGRFGRPLRVTGIYHPLPALPCNAAITSDAIVVTSSFAQPYENRQALWPSEGPATDIWAALYAQVAQADAADHRNVLLSRSRAVPHPTRPEGFVAEAVWSRPDVYRRLAAMGLPAHSSLSVVAIELLGELTRFSDPIGSDLGSVRIIRTSALTPVPQQC
jgi:hypothetical protein